MKKIPVNKGIWRKIHQIKRDKKLSTFSEVVEQLLNPKAVLKEETDLDIQVSDDDKQILSSKSTLKGETAVDIPTVGQGQLLYILSSRTWDQILEIKRDRGFDNSSRVVDYLLDAFNLMRQEKVQGKVEGMDALHEIHDHIARMGTSEEIDLMAIPKVYSEKAWLSCPICRTVFPLWVEDAEAKPERGIVFEFVDGCNQRHFLGVNDKYLPVEIHQGNDIITEKSMAINTLRCLDQRLYNHIRAKLQSAYFAFNGRRGL